MEHECCADCIHYDECPIKVAGLNSVSCFWIQGVTCMHCGEKLEFSKSITTDLTCINCKREYEVFNGKLYCTI